MRVLERVNLILAAFTYRMMSAMGAVTCGDNGPGGQCD